MQPLNIFWFRRDLRLNDNCGLYKALKESEPVLAVFIFDTNILSQLEDKNDGRVDFIHSSVSQLKTELEKRGSSLLIEVGKPQEVYQKLFDEYNIKAIYTNHDYEPYAQKRDDEIKALAQNKGAQFFTFKDQVIFEKDEVLKPNGEPYTVYTPYMKMWKQKLTEKGTKSFDTTPLLNNFFNAQPFALPTIEDIGFEKTGVTIPPTNASIDLLENYKQTRDYPATKGTSKLSVHLRFGTISIRQLVKKALEASDTFLNELIWREFYMMILWHFPHVIDGAFKPQYNHIQWRNNEQEFKAWCEGKTGIPIVDAGMRELNKTGYMHNRVRMIVASFLTKNLLIDWRWGEAYFAKKLLDFELASNNGGWQWAAGTGCDAAPYFRVFNPTLQTQKFDPEGKYIKKWVPELNSLEYPQPIVDLSSSRKRALQVYKEALSDEGVHA